jgi:hypothetical protein
MMMSGMLLGLASGAVEAGCRPTVGVEDRCYREDPTIDPEGSLPTAPPCDSEAWSDGPTEDFIRVDHVFVAFVPTAEEPCDPCDRADFETRLQARLEEQCPDQPYELMDVCYASPEQAGNDYCWVTGVFSANFKPTANDGCLGCDPATGECNTTIKEGTTE